MAKMTDFPVLNFLFTTVFGPMLLGLFILNYGLHSIFGKIYSNPKYFDIEILNEYENKNATYISYTVKNKTFLTWNRALPKVTLFSGKEEVAKSTMQIWRQFYLFPHSKDTFSSYVKTNMETYDSIHIEFNPKKNFFIH